ncbi:MAG TPA: type II toxin-antitoxin system HigB family toxin [Cytophagaceae bacterium]|jgi:mRNA interferase HigB|nr:type II toxin-antitoxin system HigB family toxin [Cytophagaceae bacterium]
MRVHLIRKETIRDYVRDNAQSKISFEEWLTALKRVEWKAANDIQRTFGAADILGMGSNRIVFNIGGNNYRMICKYAFGEKEIHLFICWIGTHAEYDKLNKENKQYTINQY